MKFDDVVTLCAEQRVDLLSFSLEGPTMELRLEGQAKDVQLLCISIGRCVYFGGTTITLEHCPPNYKTGDRSDVLFRMVATARFVK